jgi:hypothetical protein
MQDAAPPAWVELHGVYSELAPEIWQLPLEVQEGCTGTGFIRLVCTVPYFRLLLTTKALRYSFAQAVRRGTYVGRNICTSRVLLTSTSSQNAVLGLGTSL